MLLAVVLLQAAALVMAAVALVLATAAQLLAAALVLAAMAAMALATTLLPTLLHGLIGVRPPLRAERLVAASARPPPLCRRHASGLCAPPAAKA